MHKYFSIAALMLGTIVAIQPAFAADVPIGTIATAKVISAGPAGNDSVVTSSSDDFNSSVTIPANWLKVGKKIRVHCGGLYDNPGVISDVSFQPGMVDSTTTRGIGLTPKISLPANELGTWSMSFEISVTSIANGFASVAPIGTVTFSTDSLTPSTFHETRAFDAVNVGTVLVNENNTLIISAFVQNADSHDIELALSTFTVEAID